jgi:hypothetical protein
MKEQATVEKRLKKRTKSFSRMKPGVEDSFCLSSPTTCHSIYLFNPSEFEDDENTDNKL